jgi:cytochrome c oxidase subunit 4
MGHHVVSPKVYLAVFLALMAGTYLTVAAAEHDFGPWSNLIALAIAVAKATLVVLFFMHVRYSPRLTRLVVAGAFLWLILLIVGTLSDYYAPAVQPPHRVPTISRQ